MCCGLVTANKRGSRVAVVHGCFSEGGDSILSVFSWEPFRKQCSCKTVVLGMQGSAKFTCINTVAILYTQDYIANFGLVVYHKGVYDYTE